ncbi:MAG TPA: hypothetical protein VFU07_05035 [Candidatus Lumbricidophila sp.]|nr:hypothetical protein [Candidatus Lumbricidophila sp.]
MNEANLPEDAVITAALRELDRELPPLAPGQEPVELNVVGGYALIIRGVRKNLSQLTDVDYIGAALPTQWQETIDRIGVQYGLGRGWVNHDIMLSGTTLSDMEAATGPLAFQPFETSLTHFRVNVATPETLLRLKIIAVDTALTAVELGGEFTRARDLEDIARFESQASGSVKTVVQAMCGEGLLLDEARTTQAANLAARQVSAANILKQLLPAADRDELFSFNTSLDDDYEPEF